jgi:hypothetical protein
MKENIHESERDVIERWAAAVIQGLEKYTDKDQQKKILELCGYSCAKYDLRELKNLKKEARDQKELLELINKHIPWCGNWIWKKDYIYSTCRSCGCPLIRDHHLKLSPIFCLCSRGWIKAIFSEAFGKGVRVKLSKSIGRGDEYCEFFVYL